MKPPSTARTAGRSDWAERRFRRQPFILLSFFVLEKGSKSAGNAVIPTYPAHCPHGLQHLRRKRSTFAFTPESGYTLGSAQRIAHSGSHGETGGVLGGGWYHYPRSVSHGSETLRGRVSERRTLPLLGLGRGCSQRTQRAFGTAMRLCASLFRRRRGPAGLRRPTPPAERTVLAPISPRVQLCLRRPAFPLSAFIPGA